MATIGALYEDRKSGKSGVLVEIDDKHKTMMFEASDGKTFQISTTTFKSGWRKKAEEETPVVEFPEDVGIHEEKLDNVVSLSEKKVEKIENKNRECDKTMFTNLVVDFVDYAKRLNDETDTESFSVAVLTLKNGIALKWNRHRVFEVYAKFRKQLYVVFMKKELFSELNKRMGEERIEAMQNEDFIMDTFFNADLALLNKVNEALYPIILDIVKEDN